MTCRVLLGSTLVAGIATVLAGPDAGTSGADRAGDPPSCAASGVDGPQVCFTGFY
jgi:hypothetical protein